MNVADIKPRITLSEPSRTICGIIKEVADKHDLTIKEMMEKNRKRRVAWARQEAFARLYIETRSSLPVIGERFGMDHTTVLYGIWAHRKRKAEGKVN